MPLGIPSAPTPDARCSPRWRGESPPRATTARGRARSPGATISLAAEHGAGAPQPGTSEEEEPMNRVWRKAFVIAGLIFMLGGALSWGAPPNNDPSDNVGNTAAGTGALFSTTTGSFNTADGFDALVSNTSGVNNTATGGFALFSNTSGGF